MSMINLNKKVALISTIDRTLIKALEHGIPVVSRPYAEIAKQLNTTEQDVLTRLQHLVESGVIKRYGVVVRHRELGYTENGMVVWDIPDDRVDELGACIGKYACVTLSYRRLRHLPEWPYNLFTMIHGSDRQEVIDKVDEIIENCDLKNITHTILFSTRRFKQRGARYIQNKPKQSDRMQQTGTLRLVK